MTEAKYAASALVRRLWMYCNVLRDDGLSYPDYVEQLTYLLFLKMLEEQNLSPVLEGFGWSSFASLSPEDMQIRYAEILSRLGNSRGTLGVIFHNAQNKIQDPAKLRLLVADLIGTIEWSGASADVKGDAYEGLLEKNARDTKSGAGQYFTPRPLIDAIVRCVDPRIGEVVCDPACGTGGFLLGARDHIVANTPELSNGQKNFLRVRAFRGVELVEDVARLAAMNLMLHGVFGESDDELSVIRGDSLSSPADPVDVVLTNPPFGTKGSITYSKDGKTRRSLEDLTVARPDFWVTTANKQLNFVQHVVSLLKPNGRAAMVLPDNVLYEQGAGAAIRRHLLQKYDVHTLLRLPPGLFYAAGVLANVLFFDKSPARPGPGSLLVYDLRSENKFSLKSNPIAASDLEEFIDVFVAKRVQPMQDLALSAPRYRTFDRGDILSSEDCSLNLEWAVRGSEATPALEALAHLSEQISANLEAALEHVRLAGNGPE